MWLVIVFSLLTIVSVILALRKKKPYLLSIPFLAIFSFMVVKVAMVPMPFWETVQLIFSLR